MLRTKSNNGVFFFRHSRASNNSEVNSPIWPEFELIRDLMAVLVTCKFEDEGKKCVYCNMSGKKMRNELVGGGFFFFFFFFFFWGGGWFGNTTTEILAVIMLHQHKFCVYKGK